MTREADAISSANDGTKSKYLLVKTRGRGCRWGAHPGIAVCVAPPPPPRAPILQNPQMRERSLLQEGGGGPVRAVGARRSLYMQAVVERGAGVPGPPSQQLVGHIAARAFLYQQLGVASL